MTAAKTAALTLLALVAFASNSLLTRLAPPSARLSWAAEPTGLAVRSGIGYS